MKHKILFVVAHPDDESLWIGGTLKFLSDRKEVDSYVLCVTGRHHPQRNDEFQKALDIAGIKNSFVAEEDIPNRGGIPLSRLQESINTGISTMEVEDVDLVVTHSPYGDEHQHAQHVQLFNYMSKYCATENISFSFFSTFVLPNIATVGKQRDMRRYNNTHILNYGDCNHDIVKHFIQLRVDCNIKNDMLQCYQSINLQEHYEGYASWDSCVESLYFLDDKGFQVFENIYNDLESPAGKGWYR
jgi:LmbE family N-acetylglucosaminyl deacetylase